MANPINDVSGSLQPDCTSNAKPLEAPDAIWNSLQSPDSNLHAQSVAPLINSASGHHLLTPAVKFTNEEPTVAYTLKEYGTCMPIPVTLFVTTTSPM
jgi:hypothetical protein